MAKIDHAIVRQKFVDEHVTIPEIAKHFECSPQAIHRILKRYDITKADGGKSAQMKKRVEDDLKEGPTGMCKKYGCTKAQWEILRGMSEDYKNTPLAAYHTFKNNYINTHAEDMFDIVLWDWWQIWETSGKWGLHKRNPEGLHIMCQIDKTKPLSKDNAKIALFAEVLRESRVKK